MFTPSPTMSAEPNPTVLAVGIAGGSGSGKSTLIARLVGQLGPERCAVLSQDDYYRDLSRLPEMQRERFDFDRLEQLETELLVQHIKALKAGHGVEVPSYDFATHTRRPLRRRVEPAPVLLVEGILLFASAELRQTLDLRIFLSAPAHLRLQRRLERDVNFRGRRPEAVRRQWQESVLPAHRRLVEPSRRHAHLIINTAGAWEPAIRLLCAALSCWGAQVRDNT